MDNPKLKLLQPSSTRWLSVGNAVNRLKTIFASVVVSLEREAEERHDVTAAGLRHCITEYKFVATMLMLCDVLPSINRLSLLFQAELIDFCSVAKHVESTISKLSAMKTKDGHSLGSINQYMEELKKSGIDLRNQRGETTADRHDNFRRLIQSVFLDKLIENINNRFTGTDTMFTFLSIFEPKNLPVPDLDDSPGPPPASVPEEGAEPAATPADETCQNKEASAASFHEYGDKIIQKMCARFAVDESQALEEWQDLKHYLSDHMRQLNLRDVVHQISSSTTHQQLYPSMSKLAQICCVVPTHTADCERDFSQLKFVKTTLRNRLKDKTLDSILRIVLEGSPVEEFPFPEAVKMWAKTKNRRLNTL